MELGLTGKVAIITGGSEGNRPITTQKSEINQGHYGNL